MLFVVKRWLNMFSRQKLKLRKFALIIINCNNLRNRIKESSFICLFSRIIINFGVILKYLQEEYWNNRKEYRINLLRIK